MKRYIAVAALMAVFATPAEAQGVVMPPSPHAGSHDCGGLPRHDPAERCF
jgi:hypothetical protein